MALGEEGGAPFASQTPRSLQLLLFCRSALHQQVYEKAWESLLGLTYLKNVSVR